MPIVAIKHLTTYRYRQPVAFGEHRMMLRPRDDDDQKVLEFEIKITPHPSRLSSSRDCFGNHVAVACFAERASELSFESSIRVDHKPAAFRAADIAAFARNHPFSYTVDTQAALARFTRPLSRHQRLAEWAAAFLRNDGSADTRELLVEMTETIRQTFRHTTRHEKGIQDPLETLTLGSGACRDLAVLMIAALRSLGIAARFVSGYLHLTDADFGEGGNTHAWVQAYIPGPGWVDLDPSSGVIGNENLVRVAAVHEPQAAVPLQGSWIGTPSDHLAMKVAVKVSAAEGLRQG